MKKAGGTLYTTALELGQWSGIRDKGRQTLTKQQQPYDLLLGVPFAPVNARQGNAEEDVGRKARVE
jgi:hypothetical protein